MRSLTCTPNRASTPAMMPDRSMNTGPPTADTPPRKRTPSLSSPGDGSTGAGAPAAGGGAGCAAARDEVRTTAQESAQLATPTSRRTEVAIRHLRGALFWKEAATLVACLTSLPVTERCGPSCRVEHESDGLAQSSAESSERGG